MATLLVYGTGDAMPAVRRKGITMIMTMIMMMKIIIIIMTVVAMVMVVTMMMKMLNIEVVRKATC